MLGNIEQVLDLADERVVEIEAVYQETLQKQEVSERAQGLISEAIVGYRRALERTASAVGKATGVKGFTYWPNAAIESGFDANFDKNLPKVRLARPEIAAVFRKYQSFQQGYEWIADLMSLYRTEQHHDFTPQERQERRATTWAHGGAAITIGGNASISVGPGAGITISGKPMQAIEPVSTIYVDWRFADSRKSVLGTLRAIRGGIRPMLEEVCSVSGL